MAVFVIAGIGLIVLAVALSVLVFTKQRHHPLPDGQVVYQDVESERLNPQVLVATRAGLIGKPDYILRTREGLVPVELKPSRKARRPYESDLYQLAAYCVLVEEHYGEAPPYGILQYAHQRFTLTYTPQVKADVQFIVEQVRRGRQHEPPRNHHEPRRCRTCAYAASCSVRLDEQSVR